MGVFRSGFNRAMPERVLYQRDRRASFQAMGSMGVSHPMRRDVRRDASSQRRRVYNPMYHRFIQTLSILACSRARLSGLKHITLRTIE